MNYLYQTCIFSKHGCLYFKNIGNFSRVILTLFFEIALHFHLCFRIVSGSCMCTWIRNTKSIPKPLSKAKTRYLELSMSGEACVAPLRNTSQPPTTRQSRALCANGGFCWLFGTVYNGIFQTLSNPTPFILKFNIFFSVMPWWEVLVLHLYVDQEWQKYLCDLLPIWFEGNSSGRDKSNFLKFPNKLKLYLASATKSTHSLCLY